MDKDLDIISDSLEVESSLNDTRLLLVTLSNGRAYFKKYCLLVRSLIRYI
jgi:hypothetical protein